MRTDSIAIVVPVHNESANIVRLFDRLAALDLPPRVSMRVICVDDGSADDSVERIAGNLGRFPGSILLELSRNFGKEAALLAGLDNALEAGCHAVVMIDADLQHPPELIPEMIEQWRRGHDVVIAARAHRRNESVGRRTMARVFYRAMARLSDIPIVDGEGDFRLMSRACAEAFCRLREQNRFSKGLYPWVGFRVTRIQVPFDPRAAGGSKFGFGNLAILALDGVLSFSTKPLRLVLVAGAIIGSLSFLFGVWILFDTLFFGKQLPGYASLFCGMMFLGGTQLFAIGLLGEYVGKTYMESKRRPPYIVRRILQADAA